MLLAASIAVVACAGQDGSADAERAGPDVSPEGEAAADAEKRTTGPDETDRDRATGPAPVPDPVGIDPLDLGWRTECAWAGAENPRPDPDADPAQVARLHLDVGDDFEVLYGDDPDPDAAIVAGFEMSVAGVDDVSGGAEVELRGNSSRHLPKRSFDLRLDRLAAGRDSDRVSINAMYTDPAMVRERLSMWTFDQLGLMSPRTEYVDLYVDDGYEGLYVWVERVDDRLLADHGIDPAGATIVRDRTRQVEGDSAPSMLEPTDPETPVDRRDDVASHVRAVADTRGEPDWDAIVALVEWTRSALAGTPPDELPDAAASSGLADHADVDALVRFAVAQTLVGDLDWSRDDYWLVRAAGEGTGFVLVPWDKDLSFGSHSSLELGTTNHLFHFEWDLHGAMLRWNPLTRLGLADPTWRRAWHEAIVAALDGFFSLPSLCAELATLAPALDGRVDRLRGDGGEPDGFGWNTRQHFAVPGHADLQLSTVLDYAQRRAAHLRAEIARAGDAVVEPARTDGPMTATAGIDGGDTGTSVLFTDPSGWTIARLDVTGVAAPGEITVSVTPSDASPDVDRRWRVDAGTADVAGRLNLYYRNNALHGDWFRSTPEGAVEPVGEQIYLAVATLGPDGSIAEVHESAANPYADRVVADLVLGGTSDLVLVVDDG